MVELHSTFYQSKLTQYWVQGAGNQKTAKWARGTGRRQKVRTRRDGNRRDEDGGEENTEKARIEGREGEDVCSSSCEMCFMQGDVFK